MLCSLSVFAYECEYTNVVVLMGLTEREIKTHKELNNFLVEQVFHVFFLSLLASLELLKSRGKLLGNLRAFFEQQCV